MTTTRGFVCLLIASTLLATILRGVAAANVIIGGTPPNHAPSPGERYTGIAQGLFEYSRTDFNIAGPIPILMTRVYRSKDRDSNQNFIVRPFGVGFNLNYNIYLYSNSEAANNTYTDAEIVLPDGGQVVCNRTSACMPSNCTDYMDAVFQCTSTPDPIFFGAQITYNASTPGWDVTLKTQRVYSFGSGAPLQSIVDRYGNQLTLARSGGQNGKITQINSSNGTYINFSYTYPANANLITQVSDNSGRTFTYSYDSNNRLTGAVGTASGLPAIGEESYSYGSSDTMGNMTTLSRLISFNYLQPTYFTTNIQYGNMNSTVSQIATPTGNWTYTPTFNGNQITDVKIADPNGNKVKYFFNSSGYLTQATRAWGSTNPPPETTTYSRDPNNNHILSVTDNIGRVTGYVYDTLGNITSISRLQGTSNPVTTAYGYGSCGQVTSITDPLQHTISATQTDSNCNATAVADQTGNTWALQYAGGMNAAGKPSSIIDPPSTGTTDFFYDFSSGPSRIQDPLGNVTNVARDAVGRLSSITDPLRNTVQLPSYNIDDLVLMVTDAIGNSTSLGFDGIDNFLGWTDAGGNSTTIVFSVAGTVEVKSGVGGTETFVMDPAGNLTSYTGKRGITSALTYDALNRLTKIQYYTNGYGSQQTTVTYTYDVADRTTQIVDTSGGSPGAPGNSQTFGYDNLNNVTSWASPEGVVSYTYDNAGNRKTMQAGGQPQNNYCYDAANRLLTVTSGGNYQCPSNNPTVIIAYDQDGRRHSLSLQNGVSVGYGYDADSRISSLAYSSVAAGILGTLTYTYDADGRITQEGGSLAAVKIPSAVSTASYNVGNQLTNWNGTTIQSDNANNISNDPTLPTPGSTTWNERNQLISVNAGGAQNFLYDALGRRESESGSIPTATFLYDNSTPVRTITGSTYADLLAMPGGGEIFSRTDSSGTVVPLHDLAGSTIGLVDVTGRIVTQYAYTPFGKPTLSGTNNANPFQFAGMEYDSTGLYHTWARYYSPGLQRFLSEDPLGLAAGDTNIFAYVHNNPVNMVDPLGLGANGVGPNTTTVCGGNCSDSEPLSAFGAASDTVGQAGISDLAIGGGHMGEDGGIFQGSPVGGLSVFSGGQLGLGLSGQTGLNLNIPQIRALRPETPLQEGHISPQQVGAISELTSLGFVGGAVFGILIGDGATIVISCAVAGMAAGYRLAIESSTSEANAEHNEHADFGVNSNDSIKYDSQGFNDMTPAPN